MNYLADRYAVPINAVFFRYFADGPSEYLARTWLINPEKAETTANPPGRAKVRTWNGVDYYVILGTSADEAEAGRWTIARKYGFLNAGGGSWYWKPLRNLTTAHRVFAYVGGAGYVGVGKVTGPMIRLRDAEAQVNGKLERVIDQPDVEAPFRERALSDNPEVTECAVPVEWLATRSVAEAISQPGLFASQVTACKLRDERTIQVVTAAFGLTDG